MIKSEKESYIVKVAKDGKITLPVHIRKKYKIKDKVTLLDEGDKLLIIPVYDLESLFGVDGEAGIKIAEELLRDKKREIELEKISSIDDINDLS